MQICQVWGPQHHRHCRLYRALMRDAGDDPAKREHAHYRMMHMITEFVHDDVFRLNYVLLGREGYQLGECDVCGCELGESDILLCEACRFGSSDQHSLGTIQDEIQVMQFKHGSIDIKKLYAMATRPSDLAYHEIQGALHLVGCFGRVCEWSALAAPHENVPYLHMTNE